MEKNIYLFCCDDYPHFGNTNANTDEPNSDLGPRLFIEYSSAKYDKIAQSYSEDVEVLASYGVRAIGFEYDEPIENIYK